MFRVLELQGFRRRIFSLVSSGSRFLSFGRVVLLISSGSFANFDMRFTRFVVSGFSSEALHDNKLILLMSNSNSKFL